jgi:hypothetical protein
MLAVVLIGSADNRSAIRPNATCSIRAAAATNDGCVIDAWLMDDRSTIWPDTTGAIDAVGAHDGFGLVGRGKPAEQNDDGDCELSHGYLLCLG